MHVDLTCYHWNNEMTIEFSLSNQNEDAFGFNFGSSPQEIEGKFFGWFTKESEVHGKRYKLDKVKPYVSIYKRLKDGSKIKSSKPFNIFDAFNGVNPPSPESVTVTGFDL